jgi:hypothetical protein
MESVLVSLPCVDPVRPRPARIAATSLTQMEDHG